MVRPVAVFLAVAVLYGPALAQKVEKPESLAKLELSTEIAATGDDGYPSALRITIKNVGGVAVDMPLLKNGACSPLNGFQIHSVWLPDNPVNGGVGSGWGCGMGDLPSLMYRIQHEWVRLRPGEFMTTTERVDWSSEANEGPGTVEYWVEYTPPSVTKEEIATLLLAGYLIPTDKLETAHSSFHIR
jgi:hypothetical protein